METTRSYTKAKDVLNCTEVELSLNCVKMILRDTSPTQCATYVTDVLEKFLMKYADDMTMTHRELITLMMLSEQAETRLHRALGTPKVIR